MKSRSCFLACLLATILCVILESYTPFDLFAQQFFYHNGQWLISESDHKAAKWVCYTAPKIFIGIIAGISLLLSLLSLKITSLTKWRWSLLFLALCIITVTVAAATGKAITGVRSPNELIPFAGKYPYIGMLTHLLQYGAFDGGRSFPAGHASGGFALMALYFMPVKKQFRYAGLALGVAAGWAMGLYQMARGEHFLTHTLTTMFLAWAIILCVNYACERAQSALCSGQAERRRKP